jgi:signal transduction histidine kinase/ActR/RegA family two-component response regulator
MSSEILIIDADREHATALKHYLERQQHDVFIAGDAEEVLPYFEALSPNYILADPTDPDLNGVYVLKQYKQAYPLSQLVIMAAKEYMPGLMETIGSYAISYLEKPVSSVALDLALKQAREWILLNRKIDRYAEKLASLHVAQTLYQQLFDEVPCFISVQDRDFRITATNRRFKEHFGTEIGTYCYQTYKHRTSKCPDCPVADTFATGKPHQTEEVVTARSGRQYNVLTWTAPIRDENGKITQVMEMATDITQIRQLQDHLTSLGLMIGSMSHGVKGMLTGLDGSIYQLETGINKDDKARTERAVIQVRQMADRIRNMVLEILYYAKSRELKIETVDVGELIGMVVDTVTPTAKNNRVPIETQIDDGLGQFDVDPNWLQAALVNFLENAIDACIADRTKTDHKVEFSVQPLDDERLCFEISDNGMGMDQETREKMFTLFFSSKGSRGTGLGMFIAHHVIDQHGGKIEVSSTPGVGTHFVICLPRKPPPKAAPSELPNRTVLNVIS